MCIKYEKNVIYIFVIKGKKIDLLCIITTNDYFLCRHVSYLWWFINNLKKVLQDLKIWFVAKTIIASSGKLNRNQFFKSPILHSFIDHIMTSKSSNCKYKHLEMLSFFNVNIIKKETVLYFRQAFKIYCSILHVLIRSINRIIIKRLYFKQF